MNYISKAYDVVINKFKDSSLAFIMFIAMNFIVFFSLVAVYLILNSLISLITLNSLVSYTLLGILGFIFVFFASSFKGGYYKLMYDIINGNNINIINFVYFCLRNAHKFFIIGLLKLLVLVLVLSPILIVWYFQPTSFDNLIIKIIGGTYSLIMIFIVCLLFSLTYIYTIDEKGIILTLKRAFKTVIKKLPKILPIYLIYGLIVLTGIIPILNLITFFVLYPTMMSALILFKINESLN